VHTFEFHVERTQQAAAEFEGHGLTGVVHTLQRDIEKLGFPEELHGKADGVFLDLPGPWKVISFCLPTLPPPQVCCAYYMVIDWKNKSRMIA